LANQYVLFHIMGEERPMLKLNVIVVGAGLGGLCLAQALRRLNVDVAVFERDRTPWDRPQGYRLRFMNYSTRLP
jgi:cation diffusion facilitator CzcD-associated flavoprotein CzcO